MKIVNYLHNNKRTVLFVAIFALLAILATACAGPNPLQNVATTSGHAPAGFLEGLWDGMWAPFTFLWSLFDSNIKMYSVNNTGGWYDLGFVLGTGILFGGGSRASS